MFNIKYKIYFTLIIILLTIGCADKLSKPPITEGNANIGGDTVFVQLSPIWEGFNQPKDIIVGREPFLYIADTENDRIVMMNLDGQILGTRSIKRPIALAQDYRLNLLVSAKFDTVVSGENRSYNAVYKIDLFSAGHQIENAQITRILPRSSDLARSGQINIEYPGLAVFYDNSYYVARKGPNNTSIFDPDNGILHFAPKKNFGFNVAGDTLIGRVPNIDPISAGLVSANGISSITSFNNRSIDIIITLTGQNSFKTQWLTYVVTPISEDYRSRFNPNDGSAFSRPNKFTQPEGTTLDPSGNLYVADAGKDSVYKFNAFGDELQSFGGPNIFNKPHAVAYFDRTLYVADTGNNRILRFILSTDLR